MNHREKIKALIGRDFEVVPLTSGGFAVEYLNFSAPPPPKGETEQEAMEKFLEYFGGLEAESKENTDA